ncbi:MAG TPA: hypothetical protein VGC74_05215 [Stenotrophomonas sp.]|jgi:hypothetical protein
MEAATHLGPVFFIFVLAVIVTAVALVTRAFLRRKRGDRHGN